MNIVAFVLAICAAIAFFCGIIQAMVALKDIITHSVQSGQQKRWIVIMLIFVVLTVIFAGASYASLLKSDNPPSASSPIATSISAAPRLTSTLTATSVPTPTTTVAPTATACPKPCVVYQEDGSDSWQDWSLAPDWRIVDNNKLLSNDGSAGTQAGPSAIAPYSLPQGTQNFAIEVGITAPLGLAPGAGWNGHFSITACGSTASNGWQGYEGLIGYNALPYSKADILTNQDQLAQADFSLNTRLDTYRLEVRGNVISLFVNGGLVAQGTDNKFLPCGSQIGIVSPYEVIHVSSFKVILL